MLDKAVVLRYRPTVLFILPKRILQNLSILEKHKMQLHIKLVVYATMILTLIPYGLCIKCWNCRSSNDPKCADPFDNSTVPITDCQQEKGLSHLTGVRPSMCRKIRQKVNGEWRYFRDCAYLGEVGIQGDERFCLMRTGTYNIFIEYCTCNSKDGCNSSFTFTPTKIMLYSLVFLTIAVKKIAF